MNVKIATIIVNYNGIRDTIECIKSIHGSDVIVIDNASKKNELEMIKAMFPYIITIQCKKNLGFSGGNNLGIRYALDHGYTHIMLLNNDTEIDKNMIEFLAKNCTSTSISTPCMLYYSKPDTIWCAGGAINKKTGNANHWHMGEKYLQDSKVQKCTFTTGCCMMIPREIFERVGLLEEDYFMYCEDGDFCARLALAGIDINYVPKAKLWHKIGSSSSGEDSPFATYYMTRNRLNYILENKEYFYITAYPFSLLTRIIRFLTCKDKEKKEAFKAGIIDHLKRKKGRSIKY